MIGELMQLAKVRGRAVWPFIPEWLPGIHHKNARSWPFEGTRGARNATSLAVGLMAGRVLHSSRPNRAERPPLHYIANVMISPTVAPAIAIIVIQPRIFTARLFIH